MTQPPPNSLTDRFFRSVGPHFVSLSCVQYPPGHPPSVLVFSGFLIEAGGMWFYMTAGHVLRDLKKAIKAGSRFDTWRLDDQTAGNDFKGAAIPFHFDPDDWLIIHNEENGLDYATVVLDPAYCRALRAGGAIAIDNTSWGDHTLQHDYWAVLGIPSETIQYDNKTIINGKVVIVTLEPAEPPEGAGETVNNRFFAHITDMGTVTDMQGLSGAPVFALLKQDGRWRYKIIGLQSAWFRSERIVSACPIASLAVELEAVVKSVLAKQRGRTASG